MKICIQPLKLRFIMLLCSMVVLSACIEELDQELEIENKLVINGQFSNSDGLRTLTIQEVDNVLGNGNYLSATATVYKNGQAEAELIEVSTGMLKLPTNFQIEDSNSYFVEIRLANGNVYRSTEQTVRPRIATDSISLKVVDGYTATSNDLQQTVRTGIEFFAHINMPPLETEGRYYRWLVDECWKMVSLAQPGIPARICYVQESIYQNDPTLVSNTDQGVPEGDLEVSVLLQGLDYSFELQHYVNVYLHNLDPRTFDFHQKVEKIINAGGTLYDEVPGPVDGNVQNLEDSEEKVGGWVEFFLADTLRFRVRPSDIPGPVPLQCNITDPGAVPNRCVDCALVFGLESLEPPFYWME